MDESVTWGSLLPWPLGSPLLHSNFFFLIYKRKGEERQLIIGMIECNKNHNWLGITNGSFCKCQFDFFLTLLPFGHGTFSS